MMLIQRVQMMISLMIVLPVVVGESSFCFILPLCFFRRNELTKVTKLLRLV